jgi:hypothetical protein
MVRWSPADHSAPGTGRETGFIQRLNVRLWLLADIRWIKGYPRYTRLLKGIGRGGIGTGLLLTASSVIGGPAWIGEIVGLILATYARKMLGDTSAELMANWMNFVLKAAYNNFKAGVQSVEGVFPTVGRAG